MVKELAAVQFSEIMRELLGGRRPMFYPILQTHNWLSFWLGIGL